MYRRGMLSDDTYRACLQRTHAALKAWSGHVADVATCSVGQLEQTIRLDLKPRMSGACPVELVISPAQRYDIAIGGEVWEDEPVAPNQEFLALLDAIVAGRVVRRSEIAASTARPVAVETRVVISPDKVWQRRRAIVGGIDDTIWRDHHYLPYRRS